MSYYNKWSLLLIRYWINTQRLLVPYDSFDFYFLPNVTFLIQANANFMSYLCLIVIWMQVLSYAHQSRECTNYEMASLNERMQEYKRQVDRETRNLNGSPAGDGMRHNSRSSQKVIEAVMQSAAKGKVRKCLWGLRLPSYLYTVFVLQVQTIRQGYLSKRSSNLRGDWKRRFFILDSRGMLYYYRKPWNWSSVSFKVKKERTNCAFWSFPDRQRLNL